MTEVLTYVELDCDVCTRTYGVAPCTAAIGVNGAVRACFNTAPTCQDRENYGTSTVTLRFAAPTAFLPDGIDAIPSIKSVAYSPATLSLGKDIGERASLTLTFADHPHSDAGPGFDPYVAARVYNPWERGTFWSKFRVRQRYLPGRDIRLIQGTTDQALADMVTRHFVVESFSGPAPQSGLFSIVAKDLLKFCDGEKAKAPRMSEGHLQSDITAVETSATLLPSGAAAYDYSTSSPFTNAYDSYVAIGGEEICQLTNISADTIYFNMTGGRGKLGTTAAAHEAEDRVQRVLYYQAQDPADIIYDLLVNYADIPASYIDLSAWRTETAAYSGQLYTAVIAEPTPVKDLLAELIEQAQLVLWYDETSQQLRLRVLRSVTSTATIDDDLIIKGSLSAADKPTDRVSEVWTYYGLRNPLKSATEAENYRSALATIDLQADSDYRSPAIRTVYARWIPTGAQALAERLNDTILARFRDAPREFEFRLPRYGQSLTPVLGGGYLLSSRSIQDDTGAQTTTPIWITRLQAGDAHYACSAVEMFITEQTTADPYNRYITLDANEYNVNLRTLHDNIYPDPTPGDISPTIRVTCVVETGVIIGSVSTALPAFDIGDWAGTGVELVILLKGRIEGCGGLGGGAGLGLGDGMPGGTALYTRYPVRIDCTEGAGQIWGGGGGGGKYTFGGITYGAGGGAGYDGGAGGQSSQESIPDGQPGTSEAGGDGYGFPPGNGGNGGGPGLAGETKTGSGGAAGAAIDEGAGSPTLVTSVGTTDFRGGVI